MNVGSLAAVLVLSSVGTPGLVVAQSPAPGGSAVLAAGTLSFTGHATTGDFTGTTSAVTGFVSDSDIDGASGWVEARVATLVTGNRLRDRDMRASLESERYPVMRFDLARAMATSPDTDGTTAVLLKGRLTIHGVLRTVSIPGTVSKVADTLHVVAAFPLDLGEYEIGGLTKMFGILRMQPRIEVRVDLRFVRSS